MLCYSHVSECGKEQCGLAAVIGVFQAPLLRYAARLLNNVTLAQDVVQNTLVKLAQRVPPAEAPTDEVRNWLFRVVHNEAVDLIRSEERKKRLYETYAQQQDCEVKENRAMCPHEEKLTAWLLDELPPDERREIARHLEACAACRDVRDALSSVLTPLRSGLAKDRRLQLVLQPARGPAPHAPCRPWFVRHEGLRRAALFAVAFGTLFVLISTVYRQTSGNRHSNEPVTHKFLSSRHFTRDIGQSISLLSCVSPVTPRLWPCMRLCPPAML